MKLLSFPNLQRELYKYNLGEGCEEGRLHLCILGWLMGCTHLLPHSNTLPSGKLYSTVVLLLMFSDISVFINRNFWTLSCHINHTICESGVSLNASRLNVQPTLFLQMGLWLWPDSQCNHALSASGTLPDLQRQIIYSTILFVKISWRLDQKDTIVTKKGKPCLCPLHLLITQKARGLPFS